MGYDEQDLSQPLLQLTPNEYEHTKDPLYLSTYEHSFDSNPSENFSGWLGVDTQGDFPGNLFLNHWEGVQSQMD